MNNKNLKQNTNMKGSWGRWYRIGFSSGLKLKAERIFLRMSLRKVQWGSRQGKCIWRVEGFFFFFSHWLGSQVSLNYKLLLATSNNYSKQDTGPGIKGRSDFNVNHQFFDIPQTGLKGKRTLMRKTVVESMCLPSMHKGFLANLSLPLHPL